MQVNIARGEAENIQQKQRIWRVYDATDGLSWGTWCPLQDRNGYLWLGNMTGLYRYDGKEFISYTTEDGLVDDNVTAICEDNEGGLWIGTTQGVSCFDREKFTNYTMQDGLISNKIRVIYKDHKGSLWFGTEDGVSCLDGEHFINYTVNNGLADNHIGAVCEDHTRRLWFGTADSGVSCFDGRCFRSYTVDDGLIDNSVRIIYKDRHRRLWIGTRGGVSCFDGKGFNNYADDDGLAGNDVRGICEDHQGLLWFATQGGVSCFDGEKFINYDTQHGLLDNRVSGVTQDREGLLWLSHPYSGLVCFDSQTLHHIATEPVTETLIQDEQGRLWFNNENKLCCFSDGKLYTKIFNTDIFSLLVDSKGILWVGLRGGLYCYDPAEAVWDSPGKRFTTQDGLSSNTILSMLEASDGTIWVGTANPACLYHFDGEAFEAIPAPQRAILRLFEDSQGHIWIGGGSYGGGISRYDGRNFITYTAKDGLPSNSVHSILEDDTSRIWIGTEKGLCCFDGKNFITYGKEQGLFGLNHKCSAKDTYGHLWFGTLRGGLYRTNGKHFQMLSTDDGLPSNGITGLLPQTDGSMIIGTYRGIIHYHPTATAPPMIEIREVIADQVYHNAEILELTTKDADLLTINYHGLSFATRRMRYSFFLEGYDKEWHDTYDNQVRYENLPAGQYTFKVIAINRDLVCSEKPATLKLDIVPDQWGQLRAEYEAEIKRIRKLLELNRRVDSQQSLSDAAYAVVECLRELGFDRAGVWIGDTKNNQLYELWGTDIQGNIYSNKDETLSADNIPPNEGYRVVVDESILKAKLGIDGSEIFLVKGRDEKIFESIWGYPPPCPGYYRRDDRGDNICLGVATENGKMGVIAVDNYVTRRRIDETSANLFSLFGTEIAKVLTNVALRESLAQSEAKSKAILDAIPDQMFRIARDGIFLDYKATDDGEWHFQGGKIIGNNLENVMPPDLSETLIDYIHKALDSRAIQIFEYQLPGLQDTRDYEARLVISGEDEVLAIVRDITQRKRAEERIKASLAEKEVLLKEIHHRVKNNLQIISSLLNLESGYIKDKQALQIFQDSQSRVRSMALVHEKLYQSRDMALIDFGGYVRDLANYLFRMYGANSHGIGLEVNAENVSLDIDTAIPCGLIVNELMLNSLKHGFPAHDDHNRPEGSKGKICINLHPRGDGTLLLNVSDNGVGIPEDINFRKTKSLGLQLVNTLTDQLDGCIELDREHGTSFKITFAEPKRRVKG